MLDESWAVELAASSSTVADVFSSSKLPLDD